ncbi:MAG: tetratricopeptide repeat protein [Muribaculaceae bacterium]
MKISHALIVGLCSVSISLNAQAAEINPVTQAVLDSYAEQLSSNPNDGTLLFARAQEYLNLGEYAKALDDVNAALKDDSRDNKSIIFDEYMLRATIYEINQDYNHAITDLNQALRLNPDSQVCMRKLANANFLAGNYDFAKGLYERLLRNNSLDFEAISGISKVAVKQKNFDIAREYANRAVTMYPTQADAYVNRAELLNLLGEHDAAAHDLITAITLDYERSGALPKLAKMSDTNYKSVISAFDDAIDRAPQSGVLLYLRSMMALNHNYYANALHDINTIIDKKIYNNDGIYNDCAIANFNLAKFDEALSNIDIAIDINPKDISYYINKAKILYELKNPQKAIDVLNYALKISPNNDKIIYQKAIIEMNRGDVKQTILLLNDKLINNLQTPYNYILRAYIHKNSFKDFRAAKKDYTSALNSQIQDIGSYRGFALVALSRDLEATQWIENLIKVTDKAGGKIYFYAASVYAQSGDLEKGIYYLEGALANGFGSYYDLMYKNDPVVNIDSLRKLPQFNELMTQYKSNFE